MPQPDHPPVRIRPGAGRQSYRLRVYGDDGWEWLGGARRTDARGVLSDRVRLPAGALVQVYSLRNGITSLAVRV